MNEEQARNLKRCKCGGYEHNGPCAESMPKHLRATASDEPRGIEQMPKIAKGPRTTPNPSRVPLHEVKPVPYEGGDSLRGDEPREEELPDAIVRELKRIARHMSSDEPREDWPRRHQMQKWWPAEKMIFDAIQVVESMGPDIRLTDAVVLLGKAKDRIADFIEGKP